MPMTLAIAGLASMGMGGGPALTPTGPAMSDRSTVARSGCLWSGG